MMTMAISGLIKSVNNDHDSMKSHWQMSKSHCVFILWIVNPVKRLNTNCFSVSRHELLDKYQLLKPAHPAWIEVRKSDTGWSEVSAVGEE